MSNLTPIAVCVCALTHRELTDYWNEIPADIQALLTAGHARYPVKDKSKVYGETRDDWSPFSDGRSVLRYLEDVGLRPVPASDNLDDPGDAENMAALLTRVRLFIFDPLFVVLGQKFPEVVTSLTSAIRSAGEDFCVLIPNRMDSELRELLIAVCEEKLGQLRLAYANEGHGEWEAEKALRLTSYLHRVSRLALVLQADPNQQAAMDNLAPGVGIRYVPIPAGR